MLQFEQVLKRYAGQTAVGPIDLDLPAGGTTVLLGPSGCGKSTLLRLVAGLIRPDGGLVRFEGEPLSPRNLQDMRLRMGYVIQEGGLFPHLSARDNVCLMARQLRWSKDRVAERLRELTALVRLAPELLDRYPTELSGGQRQRVSLMRALMLDPHLLLLDEPLGALDPMIRHALQQELRDIFRRLGKTVLLVTHDIGEAAYLGDHIVLLRAGCIVQQGPWRAFLERPADAFVTRFINAQRHPFELEPEEETA